MQTWLASPLARNQMFRMPMLMQRMPARLRPVNPILGLTPNFATPFVAPMPTTNPVMLQSMARSSVAGGVEALKLESQAMMVLFLHQQNKNKEFLTELLQQIAREDAQVVKKKLADVNPMVRWLAAQVVARKRIAAEKELIALLQDPYPHVRHAGHQALVRLGRGTDLGPKSEGREEILRAVERWTDWRSLQETCANAVDPFEAVHRPR